MPDAIAVIIVNFNSGPLLRECLRHLQLQTHRPERVIVVDNASVDGSADGLDQADSGDSALDGSDLDCA